MPKGYLCKSKPATVPKPGEEFNERFVGTTLENGDKATGHIINEGGRQWFVCVSANGLEYETEEMPCVRIDLTGGFEAWTVRVQEPKPGEEAVFEVRAVQVAGEQLTLI